MEKSSFFNSVSGDRKYDATDWAEYFASFIGNGVFGRPDNCLQVVADGGMTVAALKGSAWINGYFYVNTDKFPLTIATADGVLQRIDRVVIQWSMADRQIVLKVKQGAASASPTPPVLQRDAAIYEMCIADVLVDAGATGITDAKITDRRLDYSLCGIVESVVSEQHTHNLNDLQGPLDVANGGTGAADAAGARAKLGITLGTLGAAPASHTHSSAQLTDNVPVSKGGTGAGDAAAARTSLGITPGNIGAAPASHTHPSTQISDTLPIEKGGTGATTAAGARNALGLGSTTGALPVANGGTGQTTVEAARNALGLGNTSGPVPLANGGTGANTAASARNNLGLGNTSGPVPLANGGTGASNAKAALTALGIFYADALPASGTDGQICLVPVGV